MRFVYVAMLLAITLLALSACNGDTAEDPTPEPTEQDISQQTPEPSPEPTATQQPSPTSTPEATPTPSPTPVPPTPTPEPPMPTPEPSPTPEPTPDPETEPVAWYIDSLAEREYDGCCLERLRVYEEGSNYTSWVIAYQSEGLRITGLMAVPHGDGPFPTVILNHGYFPFDEFQTGYDTLREVRYLASNGYVALAPDYRNYAGSDEGDHIFVPGYAYDARNAIYALQGLPEVDGERIAMFGHSLGSGLTMQNIVSGAEVKAAVLYGTVPADEVERYEARMERWSGSGSTGSSTAVQFAERYGTPEEAPEIYERMSAENYFDRVEVPVMIHHGTADPTTPVEWAYDVEGDLREAGVDVELYIYEGGIHSLQDDHFDLMMERTLAFFDEHVR